MNRRTFLKTLLAVAASPFALALPFVKQEPMPVEKETDGHGGYYIPRELSDRIYMSFRGYGSFPIIKPGDKITVRMGASEYSRIIEQVDYCSDGSTTVYGKNE